MKRLVLVSAAILAIVAAPVMAQTQPWTMTHMGTPMAGTPAEGDIVVGISVFDGEAWEVVDGVAFQMAGLPVCGNAPARPLG